MCAANEDAPSTPETRWRDRPRSASFGRFSPGASLGGDSPERTPGPGEQSPAEPDRQGSREFAALLEEAEDRSEWRAEAIRNVLQTGLGTAVAVDGTLAFEEETMSLEPRVLPLPVAPPMPLPSESRHSAGHQGTAASDSSSSPSTGKIPSSRGGLLEHCRLLEDRIEQQQRALDRLVVACEAERAAAINAQGAVLKVEASAEFQAGVARGREAQLRSELQNLRQEHQHERERLRCEVRRLQASLKETHSRAPAEDEARRGLAEEAEIAQQQLLAARAELQRSQKEGKEAKASFSIMEKSLERHEKAFQSISRHCLEALGEAEGAAFAAGSVPGQSGSEDEALCIVRRTLEFFQQRTPLAEDRDQEKKVTIPVRGRDDQRKASEVTAQLSAAQCELRRVQAETEELKTMRRNMQLRLKEPDQPPTTHHGKATPFGRTEQRSRIRAAEDALKRTQRQLAEFEEDAAFEREELTEESERLRGRISGLLRAKEASERYISSEEDAWIIAQQRCRASEASEASMSAEVRRAEADVEDARADAIEARTLAQWAEATQRRLEADAAELKAETIAARAAASAASGRDQADDQEGRQTARLRAELRRRDDVALQEAVDAQKEVLRWRKACESAEEEICCLRAGLTREEATARGLDEHFKERAEQQQQKQAKVDSAKRAMVQTAMDEQARQLRSEFSRSVESWQKRYESELQALESSLETRRQQQEQLESAKRSVVRLQERSCNFEAELQHLVSSEEELRGRLEAEGRAASALAEEARARSVVDDKVQAGAVNDAELSRLRGRHAASVAELGEEFSTEFTAFRRVEAEAERWQRELTQARSVNLALAETARQFEAEAAAARSAHQAVRGELSVAQGRNLGLREKLRAEFHAEALQQVRQEVRGNPFSDLRRELSRGLRQDLREQLRSEFQTGWASGSATKPPAPVHKPGHRGNSCSPSPSSIAALTSTRASPDLPVSVATSPEEQGPVPSRKGDSAEDSQAWPPRELRRDFAEAARQLPPPPDSLVQLPRPQPISQQDPLLSVIDGPREPSRWALLTTAHRGFPDTASASAAANEIGSYNGLRQAASARQR